MHRHVVSRHINSSNTGLTDCLVGKKDQRINIYQLYQLSDRLLKWEQMKKYCLLLIIFIIGLFLNLIWENAQAPLYEGYTGFWDHFMICFWASIVDAVVVSLLYTLLAAWYRDIYWIKSMNRKNILTLIFLGGAIAVGFEQWAIADEMWSYTDNMPVIPFLSAGLSPLLQMMLLPLLTFLISQRFFKMCQ